MFTVWRGVLQSALRARRPLTSSVDSRLAGSGAARCGQRRQADGDDGRKLCRGVVGSEAAGRSRGVGRAAHLRAAGAPLASS